MNSLLPRGVEMVGREKGKGDEGRSEGRKWIKNAVIAAEQEGEGMGMEYR